MSEAKYIVDAKLEDGTTLKVNENMFNESYLPYFYDQSRIQIFFGGGSSGKSTFVFSTVPFNLLLFKRNYLVLTKEKKMSTTSCVREVKRAIAKFKLEKYFEWRTIPMLCRCKLNGAIIQFEGLEDVELLKSIVPEEGSWTDVIMEEATNCTENDFDQLMVRQRGISLDYNGNDLSKRIYVIFNPVSQANWIYKRFFLGKWDEYKHKAIRYRERVELDDGYEDIWVSILRTTYKDNRFLSKQDIASLKNIKNPNRYKIYVLGFFGSLGKTIFEANKDFIVVRGLRETINEKFGVIRQGLDFGGGIAPYFYTKLKLNMRDKEIYIYDEISVVDITVPELWSLMEPKVRGSGLVRVESGNDIRKQLKALNCPMIPAKKGKNSIIAGITWLQGYTIYIDSRCKNIISNFELYSWKKDKSGEPIEIPEDVNNDGIDSLRYACSYEIFGGKKPIKSSEKIF